MILYWIYHAYKSMNDWLSFVFNLYHLVTIVSILKSLISNNSTVCSIWLINRTHLYNTHSYIIPRQHFLPPFEYLSLLSTVCFLIIDIQTVLPLTLVKDSKWHKMGSTFNYVPDWKILGEQGIHFLSWRNWLLLLAHK